MLAKEAKLEVEIARTNAKGPGNNNCDICFKNCYSNKSFLFKLDQIEPINHSRNEKICEKCMEEFLRRYF